jgi:hypothetical protein
MLSPDSLDNRCLAPSAWLVFTFLDGCKVADQPSNWETDSGKSITDHKYDHEGGCSPLEELERLDSWAFREQSLSKNQVNSVELPMGQYRAEPKFSWEGVTVRAQARRTKWSEMPGSARADEEMTSSIRQRIAAGRRLEINELQRRQGSTKRGLMLVHDKPGELRGQPDRPILIQAPAFAGEGATTIPRGSRAKWLEAPGTSFGSHDIVSSAWEHAAA